MRIPYLHTVIEHLDYPTYFLVILDFEKVPGAGSVTFFRRVPS